MTLRLKKPRWQAVRIIMMPSRWTSVILRMPPSWLLPALTRSGVHLLPNSYVKVTNGEEEMEVASVELKKDGYMYIFMANEIAEDESANIKVSFTPDADCPLIYTTDQRRAWM